MTDTKKTWIGTLIAAVVGIFHKAESVADGILEEANDFVNVVKKLEQSSAVQFLEVGLQTFFPPSTGLINAAKLWLVGSAKLITNAQDELAKPDAEVLADFAAYLDKLKGNNSTLYAGILNALNADYQQFKATNTGVLGLTPQMSIAAAQVVHDPDLGTTSKA